MTIQSAYDACAIIEGFCGYEPTSEEVIAAFQYLVDSKVIWSLQGWYGRMAVSLIEQGLVTN